MVVVVVAALKNGGSEKGVLVVAACDSYQCAADS